MATKAAGVALAAALGLAGGAQAEAVDCPLRMAKTARAWAIARVRVLSVSENAFAGRGDHCDEQAVQARVSQVLKGPLSEGQAVAFSLSQGACGDPNSVNDAFTEPGAELVVAFRRDIAGGLYQVRAEAPRDYAEREAKCRVDTG